MTDHYRHVIKDVSSLIDYEANSRTHSPAQIEQVCRSIKEFGFTNPVLIDEEDTIIAGHCRVTAAKRLDMLSVPCVILEGLSEEQKKAYVIADNQLALNAGWDFDILKDEVESLTNVDFDIDLLGFDDAFLGSMFGVQTSESFSEQNKEITFDDDTEQEMEIKMKFPFNKYQEVIEGLRQHGDSFEGALLSLLGL